MFRLLTIGFLVVSVTGCAFFRGEAVPPTSFPTGIQSRLYAVKDWRMEGRVGIRTATDAWQANLVWEHESNQDRLRLSGPLSQGMVSIVAQKDVVYINEGQGKSELLREPEVMLKERLGFAVPLSSLRYWMLGVPDPGLPFTPLSEGKGFRQSGWSILVERFMTVGNHMLPQRMTVQGREVKLKMIADQWEIKG